jgi:hypothetical protein
MDQTSLHSMMADPISLHSIERALRSVRDALSDGRIREEQFNMDVVLDRDTPCGTVGCIGGWALVSMYGLDKAAPFNSQGMSINRTLVEAANAADEKRGRGLYNLFFHWRYDGPRATRKDAVMAIDAWLAGSETPWSDNPWHT